MTRRLLRDGSAASTVVGAVLVLAVMGSALVYVNAFHVPRQGAAMEVAARESAETALAALASDLAAPAEGPLVADAPLRAEAPAPPLLAGLVLTPARAHGRLAFDADGARLSLHHVTLAPPGGVPAGDPVREALPGGLMRVWSLGSAAGGVPAGSLRLQAPAAYLEDASYAVEAGAVLVRRAGSSALVSPPSLALGQGGAPDAPTTTLSWRVPLLAGPEAEVSGGERAQVSLAPGPEAATGGGQRVYEATLVVQTDALAAWRAALEELVGSRGTVTVATTGPDAGTVTATILPPAGTPAGTRAVELDLRAVRYEVGLAERGAG